MRTHLLTSQRWILAVLFVLLFVLLVALSAIYTPIALQELAGVNITTTAYACGTHGGGGC
ncbi:MAG: hypothetical protein DYG89_14355 [Caldilinea sp. CFX5]|nr:hypothetical protein [Caldilinea sp. CFX5]